MVERDMSLVYDNARRFIKYTYGKNALGIKKDSEQSVSLSPMFYRAIVLDVYTNVVQPESAKFIYPPFSINAKIIGIDKDGKNPYVEKQRLFAPFFPPHIINLPEIGEEVLVCFEQGGLDTFAFWMTRIWNDNRINKSLARYYSSAPKPEDRYGMGFDVKDITNDTYDDTVDVFSLPLRIGDVVVQGRAGTYEKHTYNPINKTALLEIGIRDYSEKSLLEDQLVLSGSRTQTIHVNTESLSSLLGSSSFGTNNTFPFENPNSYVLINRADKVITQTLDKGSSSAFHRHVLGEKQNEFNNSTLTMIQGLKDSITSLKKSIVDFQNTLQSQLDNVGLNVQRSRENFNIDGQEISFEYVSDVSLNLNLNFDNLINSSELDKIQSTLEDLRGKVLRNEYLSKNHYTT